MKNNQNVEEKENKENIKNTDIGSEEKGQCTEENDGDSAGEPLPQEENIPDPYVDKSVEIRNGMYGKWVYDKKGKTYSFDYMGAAVRIKKIIVYAETQDRVLELYFYDARGEKVEFSIPRQKMTELNISEFTRKGVQVNRKNIGTLLISIFNQEKKATTEIRHLTLGFAMYRGKKVFFGGKAIDVKSFYDGKLAVVPSGKFEIWKRMVEKEVMGTDMEIILAIASAAPLIDYFHETFHTGNLLVSLVGESSTGKTTAGCLAVSLGARSSSHGSMIFSFSDTANALMNSISSSYPTVIDEGSLIRFNPTSLLYNLAEGKEKGRMTGERKVAECNTFHTSIIMTSEKSILNMCDENTGLLVRCFEFEGVTWTKSASSSECIKTISEDNFGFVIPNIASLLLNMEQAGTISRVRETYLQYQSDFVEILRKEGKYTSFAERICKMVAMIALGADFFSKATGIKLDSVKIGNKVLSYTAVSDPAKLDIGQRAWEYICQYITTYYANFVIGSPVVPKDSSEDEYGQNGVTRDCKGRIDSIPMKMLPDGQYVSAEAFLPEIVLEQILYKGGFQDKKIVLRKLREKGILHSEKDRTISDIEIIFKRKVKGYRIYLPVLVEKKEEEKWEQAKLSQIPFVNLK
ncbi:MAG: DUF927 domain-containing protein [Lachnospiraceae bacterium]|nr:DUF927 domain-containing protein [Lachnospiraceae bacterium]